MRFECDTHHDTTAENMFEAARIFAGRKARAMFGQRADVRAINLISWTPTGSMGTFNAFLGLSRNGNTTGNEVTFSVYAKQ
jgi:hypothetical protein